MVEIQPLQIEIEREEDGRFLASVRTARRDGLRRHRGIRSPEGEGGRLQVLADMMESGEELPQPVRVLFAADLLGSEPPALLLLDARQSRTHRRA